MMRPEVQESPSQLTVLDVGEVVFDRYADGMRLGGSPLNLAYYLSELGHKGMVASRVGDDNLGCRLIGEMQGIGLSTELVQIDEGRATAVVDLKNTHDDAPNFHIPSDVAWDYLAFNDDLREAASRADAICFSTVCQRSKRSRDTIGRVVKCAKGFVFCDINFRPPYYGRNIIMKALEWSNGMKMNAHEMDVMREVLGERTKSGQDFIRRLIEKYELAVVCVTLGAHGSYIYSRDQHFYAKGCKVQVQDTVGCGDAFAAAIVVGWLSGTDLVETLCLANNLGAQVATQPGAIVDRRAIQAALVAERKYATRDTGWPSLRGKG